MTENNLLKEDKNNEELLNARKKIEYSIPLGCKNIPFLDRLDVIVNESINHMPANNSIEIEKTIQKHTLLGMQQALGVIKHLGFNFQRPSDYYTEMLKSDEQIQRAKARLEATRL